MENKKTTTSFPFALRVYLPLEWLAKPSVGMFAQFPREEPLYLEGETTEEPDCPVNSKQSQRKGGVSLKEKGNSSARKSAASRAHTGTRYFPGWSGIARCSIVHFPIVDAIESSGRFLGPSDWLLHGEEHRQAWTSFAEDLDSLYRGRRSAWGESYEGSLEGRRKRSVIDVIVISLHYERSLQIDNLVAGRKDREVGDEGKEEAVLPGCALR